jgi:periplasmic protein CpxP/Spy
MKEDTMKKLTSGTFPKRFVAACAGLALAGTFGLAQPQAQMGDGMMGQNGRGGAMERGAPQDRRGWKGHGMGMRMGHGMEMMPPSMIPDLTDAQRQELRAMQREMRRQNMEAMVEMMDIREDLLEEMMNDRPDSELVKELQSRLAARQGEILESRIETRNRMHDLLTDEQREQVREMLRQQFQRNTDQ